MPSTPETYAVMLEVFSGGNLIASYRATKEVTVTKVAKATLNILSWRVSGPVDLYPGEPTNTELYNRIGAQYLGMTPLSVELPAGVYTVDYGYVPGYECVFGLKRPIELAPGETKTIMGVYVTLAQLTQPPEILDPIMIIQLSPGGAIPYPPKPPYALSSWFSVGEGGRIRTVGTHWAHANDRETILTPGSWYGMKLWDGYTYVYVEADTGYKVDYVKYYIRTWMSQYDAWIPHAWYGPYEGVVSRIRDRDEMEIIVRFKRI
jgi:hypothetical protein